MLIVLEIRLFLILLFLTASVCPVSGQQRTGTPEPAFDVRLEKSVLLPMRDGVRLSTDLYIPVDAPRPLPTVLIRMPYNKNQYMRLRQPGSDAYFFAGQGYMVAVQDMRGRFESEGEYVVSRANRDDGYDTVDWIAKQPWSNGKVGTYGCSYLGENQIQLAATRHPSHAAAIPQAAGGGYDGTYRPFLFMDGGAFEMASGLSWFAFAGRKTFNRPPPETPDSLYRAQVQTMTTAPPLPRINLNAAFQKLPVIDILKNHGFPPTDYEDFVRHIPGDPYWKSLNYATDDDRFDVPTLHVNSWYDLGPRETMAQFNLFQQNAVSERGRDHQYALISPTDHCRSEYVGNPLILGERNLGDPRYDYFKLYPDGRAFNVQETILRARYRDGYDRVVLMEAGEVYKLRLDLHATANYFGPGHRLRVEISSSNFPRFDRNLNTGGNNYDESEWETARNTIHHSAPYPSHLVLPLVRR